MRGLVAVILAIMTGMFCSVVTYLPEIGDANTAPNQHVTPTYISRSAEDTGSPNIVTGVIIDYRWCRAIIKGCALSMIDGNGKTSIGGHHILPVDGLQGP